MAWIYDAETDQLCVTYGSQQRAVGHAVSSSGSVFEVDRAGDPIRVVLRQASRYCAPHVLSALDQPPPPDEQLYTLNEVAIKLGVKQYAIREEVLDGGIPASRLVTSWTFRSSVMDLLREVLAIRKQAIVVRLNTRRPQRATA